MCGIFGFFSEKGSFGNEDLRLMSEVLQHRGPDAQGFFTCGPAGLGHRRLSIIDLSDAANQPMYSHNQRYSIVYNGEIYNFSEIAGELEKKNKILWKTTSDTEVILEAFSEWGTECVKHFNGMFAIAIYDKSEGKLYLFRDRIGIKPIFYYLHEGDFVFASELKAITALPLVKKNCSLNYEAVNDFLHLGYIPQPLSIYNSISKFPSGSYAVIDRKGIQIQPFWKAEDKISSSMIFNEEEAMHTLNNLLVSAVRYRLICDVPFGTFLSGGIDSSTVTAIAQSVSSRPVNTFSIAFNESAYNEAAYARKIANFLGTNHHEFTVTEKEAMAMIPDLNDIYDEPFADSSAIPTLMVSKLARKHVTMTLSGDGGDELFMGYGAYKWAQRLSNPVVSALRKPASLMLAAGNNTMRRAAHLFDYKCAHNLKSHIFSQEQYLFKRNELNHLLKPDFLEEIRLNEQYNPNRKLSPAEAQSLFDLNYYLKDDLLVKVDRASMHYSLETRVPLLDYRIVEFALNLHPSLKMKGNTAKYLLKKVLYGYVPESFFNRPKWGFSIPLQHWLRTDLKYLTSDYLNDSIIKKQGLFNQEYVDKIKNLYMQKGHHYLYNRLWLMIVLTRFLEKT